MFKTVLSIFLFKLKKKLKDQLKPLKKTILILFLKVKKGNIDK